MQLDLLNRVLCCPRCRRPLGLGGLGDGDVSCSCGPSYPLRSRCLDFGVEEQQLVNNWSGSFQETEAEEQARIDGWLATGLLTRDDLAQIGQEIDAKPVKAALAAGIADLQQRLAADTTTVALDLCSGMGSLFDEGLTTLSLGSKLLLLADLSTTALRQVLDRLAGLGIPEPFFGLACDVTRLPARDGSVDLVTGVAAAGNMEEGRPAMAEAYRVLRPGGELRLCELLYREDSRTVRWADHSTPGHLYADERLQSCLVDTGFADVRLDRLYTGVARLKGDFYPLVGDTTSVVLMSARRK